MEFRFDISKIFKNNISRIGNALLPAGFAAPDRRSALDTTAYVAEIINTVGQASGAAQGLNQPVTTSDRLRNTDDQVIYLMTEDNERNGLVVGLLKIGRKSLYVFDKFGETRHVNAPCVLDFYIHESRQRGGLGKILFEYMLEYEQLLPEQLAIDRPSDKLLGFLRKHYALTQKIPQMNNFVIYDGFFASQQSQKDVNGSAQMHITASPNSSLFGPQFVSEESSKRRSNSRVRYGEPTAVQTNALGRYGAPRPPCSLNQIIHNKPTAVASEPNSKENHEPPENTSDENMNHEDGTSDAVDELSQEMQSLEVKLDELPLSSTPISSPSEHVKFAVDEDHADSIVADLSNGREYYQHEREYYNDSDSQHHHDTQNHHNSQQLNHNNHHSHDYRPDYKTKRSYGLFQFNKRQTGKKNISSIVVGSNDKIEFDQLDNKGFGSVKINRPIGVPSSRTFEHLNDNDSINSRDSGNSHTADGFFDLKFYSHPLW